MEAGSHPLHLGLGPPVGAVRLVAVDEERSVTDIWVAAVVAGGG